MYKLRDYQQQASDAAIRFFQDTRSKKNAIMVFLCGNVRRFGEVKDLRLVDGGNGKWAVYSKDRQLTNVYFQ